MPEGTHARPKRKTPVLPVAGANKTGTGEKLFIFVKHFYCPKNDERRMSKAEKAGSR